MKKTNSYSEWKKKNLGMRILAMMLTVAMVTQTLSPITAYASSGTDTTVITDVSSEEVIETTIDETTGGSTDETTGGSTDETTGGSTEETTGDTTEETMDETTEEVTEESTDEATGDSADETTGEPTEEVTEEATEETTGETTEEVTEESTEEEILVEKDYSIYKDANAVAEDYLAEVELVDGEVAEEDEDGIVEIAIPIFGVLNIEETTEDGDTYYRLTGEIDEANDKDIVEYGFIWNYGDDVPTLVENDGIASFTDIDSIDSFEYQFLASEADGANVTLCAFAIYDEWVAYSSDVSKDDEAVEDGVLQPMVYQTAAMSVLSTGYDASAGVEVVSLDEADSSGAATYVFGEGGEFDTTHVQAMLWTATVTEFTIDLGDREIDPNEDVYIAIKGVLAGLIFVKVNGLNQGSVGSCVNEEYYFLKVSGSTLKSGENTISFVHTYGLISWDNINNIQILFDGGCGSLTSGVTAEIESFDFLDYTIRLGAGLESGWTTMGTQWVDVDGIATFNISDNQSRTTYVSLSLDYDQVAATQETIQAVNGEMTVSGTFYDSIGFAVDAVDELMMTVAMTETVNTTTTDWEDEEIVISIASDAVLYDGDEEPRDYDMLFDYDQQYYSTDENGPLEVTVTVDSVFGEPVSYISMPSGNSVSKCIYDEETNANEGVSLAGQFVDDDGLETTDGYLVSVNPYDRVYSYTTTFYAETNGIYEFTVTGANGTEVFYLYVTNIDNDAPTVEIVGGDSEITVLEGNDYEDLGVGAYDNRSFEDELIIDIDYDGLYDVDPAEVDTVPSPNSGVHYVVYSVSDEAGNVTSLTKKVTVISKPLSLSTTVGTKTTTNVTLTGSVKTLGEIEVVERGIVWSLSNAPTTTSNTGSQSSKYNVYNKTDFTATVSLSSLVANATYYARSYAILETGEIVYGDVVSFTANDKNYGTFAIEASKSITSASTVSLTITRTGGSDDAQTVYYSTRNGSAVSGTHYTATSSSVTFAAGETSKTISIPIKSSTSGWNLSSLVFYVELLSVTGGGSINGASNTSSIYLTTKDSFATTGMNTWLTASLNQPAASISYGKNGTDTWYIPGSSGYDLSYYSYWSTYGSIAGQFSVTSDMRSSDVGIYIDVKTSSSAAWNQIKGDYFNTGDGVRSISTGTFDLTGQAYVLARAYAKRANLSKAYVDFSGPLLEVKYNDSSNPVVSGISATSSTYKSGDTIYFTVTYNEVITVSNQDTVKIKLNIGGTTKYATYLSGSGTTRLVFSYTVEDNLEDTDGITVELTGTSVVKDFASKTATTPSATKLSGVLVSTMPYTIGVTEGANNDTTERSFTINVTKPSSHTGTGTTYKYAFSESSSYTTEVANSLQTFTNGSSVSLEGVTGDYYLYVVVQDSLGTYIHVQGSYTMENGVPNFDASISTQAWTKNDVTVSIEMSDSEY